MLELVVLDAQPDGYTKTHYAHQKGVWVCNVLSEHKPSVYEALL